MSTSEPTDSLPPSGRSLTMIEVDVLNMIVVGQRLARHGLGIPPTQRQMAEWMGCRSMGDIARVIRQLKRKGYIRRPGGEHGRAFEVIR